MENGIYQLSSESHLPIRRAALVAAVCLILMFVAAMVAEFGFHAGLVVPDNAHLTASNLLANPLLVKLGLLSFIVILITDVVVSWALYVVFAKTNRSISMLAAGFRLLYAALFGAAIAHLFHGVAMMEAAPSHPEWTIPQMQSLAMQAFASFDRTWAVALVVFGIHVGLLGWLVLKSQRLSKVIGVLLLIAGIGYACDNWAKLTWAQYADYQQFFAAALAIPAIFGELGLAIVLLWRGKRLALAHVDAAPDAAQ